MLACSPHPPGGLVLYMSVGRHMIPAARPDMTGGMDICYLNLDNKILITTDVGLSPAPLLKDIKLREDSGRL